MFSICIYWFNEEICFLLQYLRCIVFYSQIPLRIWKKSNKSFLPRYTCIIMHTVSLGLNHSCLWTKKFCSKNNIKTKLQNWEIEMINCIHYFCSPCFRWYYLRSWPDSKMKTNGEKNQLNLKIMQNIKIYVYEKNTRKKLIWEHQTLSLLLFPFSSSQGCAQSGHSDQQFEKNEIHQVQMPKEGTPGTLPLLCNKGQASAQKFPHKSINLLLKMNLALRQCPSPGLWNPCCTNSCTTSLFYVLGFATVPYLHLYGRT